MLVVGLKKHSFGRVFGQKRTKIPDKRCWSYIDTHVSGNPVFQNGKLIGALTHVLIDNPEKGYAIFAENMLETAQSVAESSKLKEAS